MRLIPMTLAMVFSSDDGSGGGAGVGECNEIKRRLQKGNTDSGNLKMVAFGAHLAAIKKLKGPEETINALKFARVRRRSVPEVVWVGSWLKVQNLIWKGRGRRPAALGAWKTPSLEYLA